MNRKSVMASMLFITASVLFFAGCGPQDVNGMENVAQIADSGNDFNILNKKAQDMDEPEEEGGCPTGGCAAASDGGCPTGNCEIPPDPDTHRAVQMPDQATAEPVKVMPTSEEQIATDIVDHHTTRHVWQPSERHHTVHKHRNLVNRHFTKVVYHPTHKRINRVIRTGSVENEVMPTEEVVEPTIDYGCGGVAPVVPVAVAPVMRRGYFIKPVVGRVFPY